MFGTDCCETRFHSGERLCRVIHVTHAICKEKDQLRDREKFEAVFLTADAFRRGWFCRFLEEDLKTPLPRKVTVADEKKLFEMAKRGGFTLNIAGRQELQGASRKGVGGIWLELTPAQYARFPTRDFFEKSLPASACLLNVKGRSVGWRPSAFLVARNLRREIICDVQDQLR